MTAALCLSVGCGWLQKPAEIISAPFRPKPELTLAEMGPTAIDAELLGKGDWVLAPPDARRLLDPALPQLVNPILEPIFAQQGAARANLLPALEHPEAPVRANAAIGLARWGDGRALEPAVKTIEAVELKLPQRRAAAEALGNLTKPSPVAELRRLIDRFGRYEPSQVMNYSPELHGDLLRALGRHEDPASDTRFLEALRAPSVTARQEALSAWRRSVQNELPTAVIDLRADPNPQVRAAAIAIILARHHPQALEFAKNALQDFETDVRLATIAGLGRFGGPDGLVMLDRIMLQEGEVLRAAAVEALHEAGALEKVWAAAGDKAWRVRRSVAHCLASHPEPRTAALAYKFLADDSGEVRKAAVAALEAWPLPAAGPVLLAAMREPTFETRRFAAEQLTRRWPPAGEFIADLPLERREQVAASLEARWSAEFGAIDHRALAAAASPAPPQAFTLTPERLDQLQQIVAACAREPAANLPALDAFGPEAVDALERLLVERNISIPEAIYRQFLPPKGAAFAALEPLASDDVNDRRRSADRLATIAAETPLRPLVVARIAQLGVAESDGLVWRGLSEAVAGDVSEFSVTLALAGLSHSSPEVRRMACEHLGRSRDPKHARTLITATADPHIGVSLAAVKSLAYPGMLSEPAPVEALLASRDRNLQFEAARTLYANRFASGTAAFERFAHDGDPEIRRRAASTMGESGDRQFLSTLVELLSDGNLGVRKTAVDGLVALLGSDVSIRADEPLPALSERIMRWQKWYAQQAAR